MTKQPNQDIMQRYTTRAKAEWYRDRFKHGRRRRTHAREVAALEALLGTLNGLNVIMDAGSGAGRFAPVFAAHAPRLIQADFAKHMLDVSRDAYPLGAPRGAYVQSDVRHLPFASGSADLVFCHRLLNHLPLAEDRSRAIAELARVSRCYVVVSCLSPPSILRVLRRTYLRWRGVDPTRSYVDIEDVCRDADKAGLKPVGRTPIRSLGWSAAFFTFAKR